MCYVLLINAYSLLSRMCYDFDDDSLMTVSVGCIERKVYGRFQEICNGITDSNGTFSPMFLLTFSVQFMHVFVCLWRVNFIY